MAFPYGQMGVVMPIAISLALFANINLGFAQPQASVKLEGGTAYRYSIQHCAGSESLSRIPEAGMVSLCCTALPTALNSNSVRKTGSNFVR